MNATVDAYEVSPRTPIPQPTLAIVSRSRFRRARARRQSSEVFDWYAGDLFRLASVLSDNSELAQHLVIQAIVSHRFSGLSSRNSRYSQELSAAVVLAWVNRDSSAWTADDAGGSVSSPRSIMLDDLHTLDDDQRAVLALCRFGGHTYREAADVLGLSAERAANLLREAMRHLHDRQYSRDHASPAV